jgi:hypothetical protein
LDVLEAAEGVEGDDDEIKRKEVIYRFSLVLHGLNILIFGFRVKKRKNNLIMITTKKNLVTTIMWTITSLVEKVRETMRLTLVEKIMEVNVSMIMRTRLS